MSEPVTRYKVRFRSLPQTKRREYGVRAAVRKAERVSKGDTVRFRLSIER